MRTTYTSRVKVTKNGKVLRRKMASSHFRSKKSAKGKQARRKNHSLGYPKRSLTRRIDTI